MVVADSQELVDTIPGSPDCLRGKDHGDTIMTTPTKNAKGRSSDGSTASSPVSTATNADSSVFCLKLIHCFLVVNSGDCLTVSSLNHGGILVDRFLFLVFNSGICLLWVHDSGYNSLVIPQPRSRIISSLW